MSSLLNRFQGSDNKTRLLATLGEQPLIAHEDKLAMGFVEGGSLQEIKQGESLVTQGNWDDDLYFILAGSFQVFVNGRPVAVRAAGTHVGEMAGSHGSRPRTATLIALQPSIVLKAPLPLVEKVAETSPMFWKRALNVISDRLEERNAKIGQTNSIPKVFVISSGESLPVVEEIVRNLDGKEIAIETWDKGTFGISEYPISSIMDAVEASDFTISVVNADDALVMRGQSSMVARDNVHVEYGISLGVLGRRRSILLVNAKPSLHIPTDLTGLTTLRFTDATPDEMRRSVRTACIEAKQHIVDEGVFVERRAG